MRLIALLESVRSIELPNGFNFGFDFLKVNSEPVFLIRTFNKG